MNNQLQQKQPLALIQHGERKISPVGFSSALMIEHLEEHLATMSTQWCDIGCLASTMYTRNTPSNRDRVRKALRRSWNYCIDRGVYLIIEHEPRGHGHNGESKKVKLYMPSTNMNESLNAEYIFAHQQLERMMKRKAITEERYRKAQEILGGSVA